MYDFEGLKKKHFWQYLFRVLTACDMSFATCPFWVSWEHSLSHVVLLVYLEVFHFLCLASPPVVWGGGGPKRAFSRPYTLGRRPFAIFAAKVCKFESTIFFTSVSHQRRRVGAYCTQKAFISRRGRRSGRSMGSNRRRHARRRRKRQGE